MTAEKATESGLRHIAKAMVMLGLLAFIGAGLTLHWPKDAITAATIALIACALF